MTFFSRSKCLSRFIASSDLSVYQPNGFALIEVLVGLLILSIALLAGLRAIANAADTQLAISLRTQALWSADNMLLDLRMSRAFPEIGTSQFSCPQGKLILVCQRKVMSTPNPAFRRVEVAVYAANPQSPATADGPRLAWLTTVIPNPASGVM
jgi:general secretion pathway protein I